MSNGEAYNRLEGALGGNNASYSSWTDPQIDSQLKAIAQETDTTKRVALYTALQKYLFDNPPFIYLYEPVTFEATGANVQGYSPRHSEFNYFTNTSIGAQ